MPGSHSSAPMRLRGAPPPAPMMNLITHRNIRKQPQYYSLEPDRQKILAQIVHHEMKEEDEYKDMEFTLENGNDKIARRIKELEFRFQRIKEIRDCHSSKSQSILSLTVLTITLPFVIYFFLFMIFIDMDRTN
ncbi:uncharacterized protein LOC134819310 [Bolinopsis microptera]|uniref:uncharacterized protein LOC134819310 n=1 Tax=Bolinopsis microptera TaxID=2820187 RepID=UPI00307A909A